MMALYALENIDDAVDATRAFLWPPDVRRWAKLALVVFFLGGAGANVPTGQFNVPASTDGGPPTVGAPPADLGAVDLALVAGIAAVVLLLALLFALVGAIMEFVLVESLRRESVTIRRYWGRHWRRGVRLFAFRVVLGLLTLVLIGGVIGLALLPFLLGGGEFSLGALLLALPVVFVLAALSGLVNGFTNVFVVPIMIVQERGVLSGWRRLWPTVRGQWKQYLAYAVMGFVLSIAGGLLAGIAFAILAVVLLIPFGLLGLAGWGLLSVSQLAGWIVIGVAAALFVLALIVVGAFLAVPVQTYLRYYALLVLGDTNEAFDLIAERRAAIRE